MKPNCAKNWITSCPIIDVSALSEKKELGGNYLLSFETGNVKLIVMKMGKVTNKSS